MIEKYTTSWIHIWSYAGASFYENELHNATTSTYNLMLYLTDSTSYKSCSFVMRYAPGVIDIHD